MDTKKLKNWLDKLQSRDPKLHARIMKRAATEAASDEAVAFEAMGAPSPAPTLALETIVLETGRPAIPIKDNLASLADAFIDADSREIVDQLKAAEPVINPLIPLIGRIDVLNYPISNVSYVGTGWQIEPGIVVTNRHVARLIGQRDGRDFAFVPGAFGEPLQVNMDYRHELDSDATDAVPITEVIWIEEDKTKADIAFLRIADRSDGSHQNRIELADEDANPGESVAVIGYPAKGRPDAIPNQELMDRIYGGHYDIKRIAPGLMDDDSQGWATHDCTTLGGNSGSVVVNMANGKAVALHFAGLYMIENYAVPASTIRRYVQERPWHPNAPQRETGTNDITGSRPDPQTGIEQSPLASGTGDGLSASATLTIPVKIRVEIGRVGGDQIGLDATPTVESSENIEVSTTRDGRGDSIISIHTGQSTKNDRAGDD